MAQHIIWTEAFEEKRMKVGLKKRFILTMIRKGERKETCTEHPDDGTEHPDDGAILVQFDGRGNKTYRMRFKETEEGIVMIDLYMCI